MEAPEKITSAKCFACLTQQFPELSRELEGEEESVHLQMMEFSIFTKNALRRGDLETLSRCIKVADFLFDNADSEVSNAISVSFLEHFDTRASYAPRLRELFTPALREGWEHIDRYMAQLLGKDWTEREVDH